MYSKKIFTPLNKSKLSNLYKSLLKNAIAKKEAEYKQAGYDEFNVKNDVLRVCGKTTPRACKYYLQGLILNIPFENWKIREELLNFLGIENESYIDSICKDTCDIEDQYWDGMAIELSILCR